jgi:hypothetical protein
MTSFSGIFPAWDSAGTPPPIMPGEDGASFVRSPSDRKMDALAEALLAEPKGGDIRE